MAKIIIGKNQEKTTRYELNELTKHAAILGTTGSGKTVMCKILIEEALQKEIPVIAIDPKGDIGGLGIHNKNYDFRPFLTKNKAQKTANQYVTKHQDAPEFKHETKIYTPKNNAGLQASLIPDLKRPKNYEKINQQEITTLIEPISHSITNLAGITTNKEKIQTLISEIIIKNWNQKKDLTIQELIQQIINPEIQQLGTLNLEEFIKEKDRQKAASQINLLLTSPSKKIWAQGQPININELYKKNKLTIFDLRYCQNTQEKQFVTEQILQEIYKYLLERGGTNKLKYILYIDELAGLLPPPPSNPTSKKLLETLIRQARAFGLGIIVATQNPGDIDYKILGNIGTRFIGKLRTQNDIEKVASATDNKPAELKQKITNIKTSEFILNNAIKNTNTQFKTRWLYTLHEGPLKEQEIKWINNPETQPKKTDKLIIKQPKKDTKQEKTKQPYILDNEIILRKQKNKTQKETLTKKIIKKNNTTKDLQTLIKQTKKHADETNMNIALTNNPQRIYTPHIKIIITPKPYKNNEIKTYTQTYDLTTKIIPISNYITKRPWSQYAPETIQIEKPKINTKKIIEQTIKDAKQELKITFYESKITNQANKDQDIIIKENEKYLEELAKPKIQRIKQKTKQKLQIIIEQEKNNKQKIKQYKIKTIKKTTTRAIKKIFTNKKLLDKTKEMKHYEKRIKQLKKEQQKLQTKQNKIKNQEKQQLKKIHETIHKQARKQIKTKKHTLTRKDIHIKALILLIPKKINKK